MAFRNQTIDAFMQELSSKAPVPGGGGASALVGALTVGKPKYAAVEAEMQDLLKETEALADRFLKLMDEDAEAFEPLAQAYRLPKETEEEKASKTVQMEAALKSAVQPPLAIMETCAKALPLIALCAEKGSVVAVSDAGVAASLCRAALEGASLNVFINTQGMQDKAYAESLNARAKELLIRAGAEAETLFRSVYAKLGA
jgi:formiminotetrahydrofolate cyclodeaminase